MFIVLSSPVDLPGEQETIRALMEHGLKRFHLRKPGKDKGELEEFLRGIPPRWYRNIVIHAHYSLTGKYNLGGIHLPEQARKAQDVEDVIKAAKSRGLSVSTSVHDINALSALRKFDYVFLSPVFNSISKKDYAGKIDLEEFRRFRAGNRLAVKVIGLGGINAENFPLLPDAGFDGGAVLGAVWESQEPLQEFVRLRSLAQGSNG